jgi:hypothetical protein
VIANSLFVATLLFVTCLICVVNELTFLARYRDLIFHRYGTQVASFSLLLFLNLFAAIYALNRKLFLKDTGKKLAHLEKQLRTSGSSISEELSEQLED